MVATGNAELEIYSLRLLPNISAQCEAPCDIPVNPMERIWGTRGLTDVIFQDPSLFRLLSSKPR
jgi:hypothetical protein